SITVTAIDMRPFSTLLVARQPGAIMAAAGALFLLSGIILLAFAGKRGTDVSALPEEKRS
ncbi:MAG: hypothetical protein JW884_00005, partial [Deltaproteobacteria bacterium]|nr:hypothetical protein [Deltaproteobacteria bacterium]